MVDADRDTEPLTVHVTTATGEERITARAVLDASGTWAQPNPLGGDGLPALGERAAADRIAYQVPDLDDPAVRARYAGKRIAVAGAGHSALTALVALRRSRRARPGHAASTGCCAGERSATPSAAGTPTSCRREAPSDSGPRRPWPPGHIRAVDRVPHRRGASPSRTGGSCWRRWTGADWTPVDEVVVVTGFRPDLSFLSEVRLDLDPVLQAPRALAPLIDPNMHSCGTVYPHGAVELAQPEPGVYLVGMKSYGRAPTFLALTGYEQVRSVAAAIAGDREAAERVELVLPETGVCSGGGLIDETDVEEGPRPAGAAARSSRSPWWRRRSFAADALSA